MQSREKLKAKFADILEGSGIDPDESILVPNREGNGPTTFIPRPRFQFISWGMEKAVSRYAYCHHMVALGVLRRNPLELASQITGQREDLSTDLASDRDFVRHVQASEQFYHLQQFIGRGRCREVDNGQAKAATVRVYDQADFAPWTERGLPGATWDTVTLEKRKEPSKRRPKANTRVSEVAGLIEFALASLPCEKTSVRSLKEFLGYTGCPKLFGRALGSSLESTPWVKVGRSIEPA